MIKKQQQQNRIHYVHNIKYFVHILDGPASNGPASVIISVCKASVCSCAETITEIMIHNTASSHYKKTIFKKVSEIIKVTNLKC